MSSLRTFSGTGPTPAEALKGLQDEVNKQFQGGAHVTATLDTDTRKWIKRFIDDLSDLVELEDGTAIGFYLGERDYELPKM